jgi:DNA-binding SARP family transcriptional activator/predicted ATPase
MARLRVNLLGSFQVRLGEAQITRFESNKVRALLAYLAVESGKAHHREYLAELFWPNMTAVRSKSNLSGALYNLRRLIGDHQADPPYLLRSRDTVQFNPQSDYRLDVDTLTVQLDGDRVTQSAGLHTDPGRLDDMRAAVELYRGDFLEGLSFEDSLAFDEWVMLMRQRLQRQVLAGLYLLAATYAERDDLPQALAYAWRQVELDPLDERAARQLMELLVATNQRSQALTHFERLQVMLAEELGVAPEPQTATLRDKIRGEGSMPAVDQSRGDNLPVFLTPLIGRQQELAEIRDRCANPDCRLLTILGPGGSGKTRLALEAAGFNRETFRHGVFFVPLNPVQSPESIIPSIVDALDLPLGEQGDHQSQLINYLRGKNLLLVVDGFEHLLEGAVWIAEILHQTPGVKILVTSRTRLNIKGEHLYLLGGMHYPQAEATDAEILASDAVQLLITGLQRTRPEYQPAQEEIKHLGQICQKVQGMPLGILLAASWGGALSVAQIDGEVDRGLEFLAADWTDVPARQRSLRATFDHTWKLLAEPEQRIFQSLSVFRGAFTRKAASAICGASPHEMRALVNRSLLWSGSPGWYEVHELLRQYGREKLARSTQVEREVCNRHSHYYLEQLVRLEIDIKSNRQGAALANIDLEHENYRAAWDWAAGKGDIPYLAGGLEALCLYYDLRVRFADGENACKIAVEGISKKTSDVEILLLLTRLFAWQSRFTRLLGQTEVAVQLTEKAHFYLEKAKSVEDQAHLAEASLTLEQGNIHFYNDCAAAANCYRRSLQIYRRLEDLWGTAKALSRSGLLAHHVGSFEAAVQDYSECLGLYQRLGDPRGIANALIELGHNTLRQGDVSAGQGYIQEGTDILQQIGDRSGVAQGYLQLGRSYFWSGQFAKGAELMMQSVPILEDLGMRDQMVFSITAVSLALSHLGKYSDAINQAEKGLPLAKEIGARREIAMAYLLSGKAYLGQRDFEQTKTWALKSIAQYQEIDQRDELAWASVLVYFTLRGLGRVKSARPYLCQTLEIGIQVRGIFPILCGLCGTALLLLDQGEIERAVELVALAWRYPVVSKSIWFEDVAVREIAAAADTLPPEMVAVAQKRGAKRDIWETASELLEQLA